MHRQPFSLRKEIYLIVIIKLLLILGLWWGFFRDAGVAVDGVAIAQHLARPGQSAVLTKVPGEAHAQ